MVCVNGFDWLENLVSGEGFMVFGIGLGIIIDRDVVEVIGFVLQFEVLKVVDVDVLNILL